MFANNLPLVKVLYTRYVNDSIAISFISPGYCLFPPCIYLSEQTRHLGEGAGGRACKRGRGLEINIKRKVVAYGPGWSGGSGQGLRKAGRCGSRAWSQMSTVELFLSDSEVDSNDAKQRQEKMHLSIRHHLFVASHFSSRSKVVAAVANMCLQESSFKNISFCSAEEA